MGLFRLYSRAPFPAAPALALALSLALPPLDSFATYYNQQQVPGAIKKPDGKAPQEVPWERKPNHISADGYMP